MSEKKSWDVQPKRRSAPAPHTSPTRSPERVVPVRTAPTRTVSSRRPEVSAPVRARVQTAARREAPQPLGALSKRRKKTRQTNRYIFLILLALLCAGAVYGLWRPAFRIQSISAEGAPGDAVQHIAQITMTGSYFYLIPKNSIVFYPKEKIRAAILDANPEVSAVSLTATSFSSLSIYTTPRAQSFLWCGTDFSTPSPDGYCYQSDIEGFIFAQDSHTVGAPVLVASTSSSTPPLPKPVAPVENRSQILVYGPLDRDITNGNSPTRAHLVLPGRMPEALKFVNAIRELGAPITSLVIRGDEADLWIGQSTRITYVLGHERDAASSAASSLSNLALTNGSIQYVDLRFPGKVYVKKYGE